MPSYPNIEIAYKDKTLTQRLASVARGRLRNGDYAVDCVNDAFVKVLEYMRKHKGQGKKVSEFLLMREVIRAARRYNKKYSNEVSLNDEFLRDE